MKKLKAITIIIGIILLYNLAACTSRQKNKEMEIVKITDKGIQSQFKATPDESINLDQASEHFEKYPERWIAAFKFLIESDLEGIPPGRTDLSEHVYVTVSEYETKNPEDARFESHRKYIDLQYVVGGEELIGLTHPQGLETITPYSDEEDIVFYEYDGGEFHTASPSNYFLFFPDDAHRPGVDPGKKNMVKKIVVKIKYD